LRKKDLRRFLERYLDFILMQNETLPTYHKARQNPTTWIREIAEETYQKIRTWIAEYTLKILSLLSEIK
jgi:hypothetical protein